MGLGQTDAKYSAATLAKVERRTSIKVMVRCARS